MTSFAVKLACWLLKQPLTLQQRTKLIGTILSELGAVPLTDVIKQDMTGLYIDGRRVEDPEVAQKVKEAARAALNNYARRYIRQQVAVIAGKRGIVEGDTPEKLYFYRAALWFGMTEEELYKQLAGM